MPLRSQKQSAKRKRPAAEMSLREVGKRYGLSMQSIQQIEKKALLKIRYAIEQEARRTGCTQLEWLFGDE